MVIKKIIMNGPGHGSNMEKWIRFFGANGTKYHLTFISETKYVFDSYDNVVVYETNSRKKMYRFLLKALLLKKQDLFILHHAYSVKWANILLTAVTHKKSIFLPWGYKVVKRAIYETQKKYGYRRLLNKIDLCTGNYHIVKLLKGKYPHLADKFQTFLWGIDDEWFNDAKEDTVSVFTNDFLSKLAPDDVFVFWPRSILRLHKYDVVIKALNEIKKERPELTEKLKLVIWVGNANDEEYKQELLALIKELSLEKNVIIQSHPYIKTNELKMIWKRCDFSINMLDRDGFSTQISEAFLFKKPIIMSKIPAYEFLNQEYDLKIDFTENNVDAAKVVLEHYLQNYSNYSEEILEKRKTFVEEHMNFNHNLETLITSILQ